MQKKILVIDDEKTLLALCKRILENSGFEVITSHTRYDAIEKIANGVFDLVIIDCTLGIYMGESLLDEIRGFHPDTGVIVISGYFNPEEIEECLQKGAFSCIEKPFDNSELLDHVRSFFSKFPETPVNINITNPNT